MGAALLAEYEDHVGREKIWRGVADECRGVSRFWMKPRENEFALSAVDKVVVREGLEPSTSAL